MGSNTSYPLAPNWDKVKETIITEALLAKFTQHDELKQKLLGTNEARLVEHSQNDGYWGDHGDGLNRLGELLMIVREELKESIDGGYEITNEPYQWEIRDSSKTSTSRKNKGKGKKIQKQAEKRCIQKWRGTVSVSDTQRR